MSKPEKLITLKPNVSLLDSNFESYKLSLENLTKYKTYLEYEIDSVEINPNQFSFQHHKAFSSINGLIADPYNNDIIFVIDKFWKVHKINIQLNSGSLQKPYSVFQIPDYETKSKINERYSTSLSICDPNWLVIGDGTGSLYIIKTGSRDKDKDHWRVHFSGTPIGENESFLIQHTFMHKEKEETLLNIILLSVNGSSKFHTVYNWLTFVFDEKENWNLIRTRRLEGESFPDYCCTDGSFIYVATEKPPEFVYDSLQPIIDKSDDDITIDEEALVLYHWHQNENEIIINVLLEKNTCKSDIECNINNDHLTVRINKTKSGEILTILDGKLFSNISVSTSTWTLVDDKLEIFLSKVEKYSWNFVVVDNHDGKQIFSPEQAAEIHEHLSYLTSDKLEDDGEKKNFNAQQLEECDSFPEDSSTLQQINGDNHKVNIQANLSSHKHLFVSTPVNGQLPDLCIRHDVDGLVWRINKSRESLFEHIETFNALGYVVASKQNKKYLTAPPDYNYSVVCDCVRRLYVYRRPVVNASLRNRKETGLKATIAKQSVVSFEENGNIVGLVALNGRIVTLIDNNIYVIYVDE